MDANAALLVTGGIAGLSIAVPIGPLGMLCVQRSLYRGFLAGWSTGLGGVTVNVAYAGLLLLGLRHVLPMLADGGRVLGVVGGLFLLWSAVRVFASPPHRPSRAEYRNGRRTRPGLPWCYLSAAGFNAMNPMSLVLMVAALSPTLQAGVPGAAGTAALLAGMALAAALWWACLSLCVTLLRSHLSPAVLAGANQVAGGLLGLYAGVALARACLW